MKRLIAFLSVVLSIPAYAENFTANDKVLFFSTDVLIEVIERNFDKSLQLGVANKYTELMDATTHSVSIADLISVCGVGNLDREKCRNFINDLLTTMDIGDTVKPFYWADYIPYRGDEPSNTFVPHMGFEQDTGIWTIRFPWMKEQSFRKQYPNAEHLGGISACTNESGNVHVADASKNFAQNEQTGNNCWCKMTFPEESAWVYHTSMDSVTISTGETTDANTMCSRGCALECLGAVRGADESMRAAMFTAVKLNGANEPGPIDPEEFKKKFKKCEFDWRNAAKWDNLGSWAYNETTENKNTVWFGWKTQKPPHRQRPEYSRYKEWEIDFVEGKGLDNNIRSQYEWEKLHPWEDKNHYEANATGLQNEEWAAGGFGWMKSENFQCKYPGVTKIKGVAACTSATGKGGQTANKSFRAGETTGCYCWCKMTYPETSKWILTYDYCLESERTRHFQTTTDGETGTEYGKKVIIYPEEGKKLALESDIAYCDSSCLEYCGPNFGLFETGFSSIGKK